MLLSNFLCKHKNYQFLQSFHPLFGILKVQIAQIIEDIDLPGYQLHSLKGEREGIWAISVNGNWRVTFEFKDGNAYILNYEDYH